MSQLITSRLAAGTAVWAYAIFSLITQQVADIASEVNQA